MMKKFLSIFAALSLSAAVLTGCGSAPKTADSAKPTEAAAAKAGEAPDYSKKECWYQIPEITKDVDTFYIYATEYIESSYAEGASDYATMDNPEMLEKVPVEYREHATTFADSTNVFVPYYRQAGLRLVEKVWKENGNVDTAFSGMPYEDITAAIDYYFKNYNNGRPFIIASHSQGSAIAQLELANYFKEHPEYYERMVAAYIIGYGVTDEYLEANPHLKFATGEEDTGVIVSWNTEGKKSVEENAANVVLLPNSHSINPINWKTDDTYAPASENKGSLVYNEKTGEWDISDIGADAQINLARGVIVTNVKFDFDAAPELLKKIFGPESFHGQDYTLYYNNIKENVAKRVAAYKESH